MPGLPRANGAAIGRLRLRGAAPDPLAARLRLEALLGATADPPALPPGAVLCLRRLRDPLPGALPLHGHSLRPPSRWARAWGEALDAGARGAARPALGAVPAGAEAVVFSDPAELFGCLARDLAAGLAGGRWWWQAVWAGADLRRVLFDAWRAEPELAPPALERLAREDLAAPVLAAFGEGPARDLAAAVAARHGALALLRALDGDPPAPPAAAAPLDALAPELARVHAPYEARTLLAVALLVRRAPALLRGAALGPVLSAWRARGREGIVEEKTTTPIRSHAPEPPPAPDEAPPARLPPERDHEAALADGAADLPLPSADAPPLPPSSTVEERAQAPARPPADEPRTGEAALAAPRLEAPAAGPTEPGPPAPSAAPSTSTRAPAAAAPAPAAPEALPPPSLLLALETELGGLFYLVNVALALGLYGDFTTPLEPGIDLSPWDFVALLGRALLGGDGAEDPVFALLARLSGHAPDAPLGDGFAPPWAWRPPPGWGAAREADAADPRAGAAGRAGVLGWFDWLGELVAARLAPLLGCADRTELAAVLLRRHARVRAGETRVDVELALAELPLAVRLAGLDRDPGWVPAAGRSLYFHFG